MEDTIREFNRPCGHFISDHHAGMSTDFQAVISLLAVFVFTASKMAVHWHFEDKILHVHNEGKLLHEDEIRPWTCMDGVLPP